MPRYTIRRTTIDGAADLKPGDQVELMVLCAVETGGGDGVLELRIYDWAEPRTASAAGQSVAEAQTCCDDPHPPEEGTTDA